MGRWAIRKRSAVRSSFRRRRRASRVPRQSSASIHAKCCANSYSTRWKFRSCWTAVPACSTSSATRERRAFENCARRVSARSEITEHQVELDVTVKDRSAVHTGDAEKTNVQRVFVRAYLRYARQTERHRQPQQLRNLSGRLH